MFLSFCVFVFVSGGVAFLALLFVCFLFCIFVLVVLSLLLLFTFVARSLLLLLFLFRLPWSVGVRGWLSMMGCAF